MASSTGRFTNSPGCRSPTVSNHSPVQPQLLSRINEALVLRSIRQNGPSTRGELSQQMGVTFPTVAKAVASLLEARLLEEFDDETTGPGRPAKRLRLSKERSQVVGVTVDVEGSVAAAVAVGRDGYALDRLLSTGGLVRDDRQIPLSLNLDHAKLAAWFDQVDGALAGDLGLKPHDAFLVIEGTEVRIEPEIDGTV